MARFAPFKIPLTPIKRPPQFVRTADGPLTAIGTHFSGAPSQAILLSNNVGKEEQVGWRISNCKLSGKRKWQPKHRRYRVNPRWLIRAYMMSDLKISGTFFGSRELEHDIYVDLDFEHGDVELTGNYHKNAMSQAIQVVGPWSRPENSGWPDRAGNDGNLYITKNLIVGCGQYNYWAQQGISRPSFAISVFRAVKKLSCYVHGNHLKSRSKTQPDGSRSYGAMMFDSTRYLEVMDNLVEYKQPSDRDVLQFNQVDELVAERNTITGGHVRFDVPNEVVWQNNKGWGTVKYTDGDGKTHLLGDVTGKYVFRQGKLVESEDAG